MMFPLAGVFARLGATGLQGNAWFSLSGGVERIERLEVIAGPKGRRSWSDEAKARIVLESHAPGARVVDVALLSVRRKAGIGLPHQVQRQLSRLRPCRVATARRGLRRHPSDDEQHSHDPQCQLPRHHARPAIDALALAPSGRFVAVIMR
jgi:hypothetical protein